MVRRGPLARAPGVLKGGHCRNYPHFRRSLRRDPLEKQQIFEKKSHNAEKLKWGPLGFFNIHSVAKHQKIEVEKFLFPGKKSHSAEKN